MGGEEERKRWSKIKENREKRGGTRGKRKLGRRERGRQRSEKKGKQRKRKWKEHEEEK